jgi:hypothetical protein
MTMTTGVVFADDATQAGAAIAGFLAGYCGSTRRSYATDLRLVAPAFRRIATRRGLMIGRVAAARKLLTFTATVRAR